MLTPFLTLWLAGILLCLLQFVATLPWLAAVDSRFFASAVRRPRNWGIAFAGIAGAGLALALFLMIVQDRERLYLWGRLFASLLQIQLIADGFLLGIAVILWVWPRGGAVALAAFREGVRQPLFWLFIAATIALMGLSLFVPYFTFGDDFKMMKQLGFDMVMLGAVAFSVIAAGMSISDEIEGRTAITLMSKPVSRREFLLGKYVGILLAGLLMTALLGWALQWALYFKPFLEWMPDTSDPLKAQIEPALMGAVRGISPVGEAGSFLHGMTLWSTDTATILPGLVIGFCQVMVLLAIAAALATRLPMVVNLVTCLLLFFLGNLAPVLVEVSRRLQREHVGTHQGQTSATLDLVQFMARLFDTVLPALEYFNLGPAIVRDRPLPIVDYGWYVGSVVVYALLYTAIALLFGLILFEDRDLA
ncbi:MAG: ABC transporter permease [Gemmataceae bacterium]|nr:ABC transporter permease [Gemmataceae bacterium]